MDDEAYARALLEELELLAEDLLHARKERDDSREHLHSLEEELASLHSQLQQRKQRINLEIEMDALKRNVDARKREKAQLLKQLATMQRECLRLQRAAGLEPLESPVNDQAEHDGETSSGEVDHAETSHCADDLRIEEPINRTSRLRRSSRKLSRIELKDSRRAVTQKSRSCSVSRRRVRSGRRQKSLDGVTFISPPLNEGNSDETLSRQRLLGTSASDEESACKARQCHPSATLTESKTLGSKRHSGRARSLTTAASMRVRVHSDDLSSSFQSIGQVAAPVGQPTQTEEADLHHKPAEKSTLNFYPKSPVPDRKEFRLRGTVHDRKTLIISLDDFSDDDDLEDSLSGLDIQKRDSSNCTRQSTVFYGA